MSDDKENYSDYVERIEGELANAQERLADIEMRELYAKKTNWIKVSDKLPEPDTGDEFLVTCLSVLVEDGKRRRFVQAARYGHLYGVWNGKGSGPLCWFEDTFDEGGNSTEKLQDVIAWTEYPEPFEE